MERENNPSPQNSPKSNGSSSNNGAQHQQQQQQQQQQPQFLQTPPLTPKPITSSRSETTNPYPTTFVQADTTTFKHVVQMLTGSSTSPNKPGHVIPPVKTAPRKQSFKLYERRSQAQNLKNSLIINTLVPGRRQSQQHEILSPSILDFPKLALNSPVTPLNDDPFDRSSIGNSSSSEEDRAIAEKGFFLHPSPRDGGEPQLLPLFPVTSPRVSDR